MKYVRTKSGDWLVVGPRCKCNFCGKYFNADTEKSPYVCKKCLHHATGKQITLIKHWRRKGFI